MGKLRRSWPKASPAGKRLNKWWRNYMRSRGLRPLLPARRAMSRCGLDPPHRLRVATVNSLCELTVVFFRSREAQGQESAVRGDHSSSMNASDAPLKIESRTTNLE